MHQVQIELGVAIDHDAPRMNIGAVVVHKRADRCRRAEHHIELREKLRPLPPQMPPPHVEGLIGSGREIDATGLQRLMRSIARREFAGLRRDPVA